VPLSSAERRGTLWRVLEGVFSKRDHEFESGFLQRGVGCEPDFLGDAGKQRSAGFTDPPKLPLQIFFGWIGTRDRRVPEESTAA
jgi:hypothetical protein